MAKASDSRKIGYRRCDVGDIDLSTPEWYLVLVLISVDGMASN